MENCIENRKSLYLGIDAIVEGGVSGSLLPQEDLPLGGVDGRRCQPRGSNGVASATPEQPGAAHDDGLVRRVGRGECAAEGERGGVPLAGVVEGDFGDGHYAAADAERRRDGAEARGSGNERGARALALSHHVVGHHHCAPPRQ